MSGFISANLLSENVFSVEDACPFAWRGNIEPLVHKVDGRNIRLAMPRIARRPRPQPPGARNATKGNASQTRGKGLMAQQSRDSSLFMLRAGPHRRRRSGDGASCADARDRSDRSCHLGSGIGRRTYTILMCWWH